MYFEMLFELNPDCAVDIYCGLKILVQTCRNFTILLLNIFMNMPSAQNGFKLRVSLRFSFPRYGALCTIWVKKLKENLERTFFRALNIRDADFCVKPKSTF